MALKNWAKQNFDFKSLSDAGVTNKWTVSTVATEYYYNQSDLNGLPLEVFESSVAMTLGVLGALAVGEYALGDNDTLGGDTIYVRLSDSTDPDAGVADLVECTDVFTLITGGAGNEVVLVNTTISNLNNGVAEVQSMAEATIASGDVYALSYNGKTLISTAMDASPTTAELLAALTGGDNAATYAELPFVLSEGTSAITITWKYAGEVDALCTAVKTTGSGTPTVTETTPGSGDVNFIVYFTDSSDAIYFQYGMTLSYIDGPFSLSSKFMLNDEDKVKVQASTENFAVIFSGDET